MTVDAPTLGGRVDVVVEPMRQSDMPTVLAIESASFSSPWPARAYRYELRNDSSHYFVLRCRRCEPIPDSALWVESWDGPCPPYGTRGEKGLRGLVQRMWHGVRPEPKREIIGYGGYWISGHRAHISTLAVAPKWRRRRLGLLLLLHMLDHALTLGMTNATLEVRASNCVAQNLYRKCGFRRSGIQTSYYRDNGEDALLMRTPSLTSPTYRDHLHALWEELQRCLGPGTVRRG
jgi:ribosomal-protein-alanine N-acetyltransferase